MYVKYKKVDKFLNATKLANLQNTINDAKGQTLQMFSKVNMADIFQNLVILVMK